MTYPRVFTYPLVFEELWTAYPHRPNNPKRPAWIQFQRRLREEIDTAVLLSAVKEYAHQMSRSGKVGTEYVMQAQTFLGPNERWLEFVPKPEKPKQYKIKTEILVEERIDGRPFIRDLLAKLASSKAIK